MIGVVSSALTLAGGEWLLFACRSPYLDEVAEIVWRSGGRVAGVVDNLAGGGRAVDDLAGGGRLVDNLAGGGAVDNLAGGGAVAAPVDAMPVADPWTCDYAPVIDVADLAQWLPGRSVVVALSVPGHRFTVAAELRFLGVRSLPALVDPSAIVARTASIGAGCLVNAGVVIGARTTLGEMALVNRSASVGHHNAIGDYAALGPGCVLAGSVTVGRGAFVGAGAVLAPHVTIGANATVGAGAVVVSDVPELAVVVGNPGRVLRIAEHGYGGTSVVLP